MLPNEVLYIANTTVLLIFYLSMPIIIAATVVGLVVALLQTLIQLQEQTLGFAVKLAAIIVVFLWTGASMANELMLFTYDLFDRIMML